MLGFRGGVVDIGWILPKSTASGGLSLTGHESSTEEAVVSSNLEHESLSTVTITRSADFIESQW